MVINQTIAETREVFAQIADLVQQATELQLLQAPSGKWNIAQQVRHLVLSQRMTTTAFKVPSFAVSLLFGKSDNGSRGYEEVVADYQRHLAGGAKSTAEYEPRLKGQLDKPKLLADYQAAGEKYLAALASKTDKELDTLQVKHPILGKLTLRELAHFTLYHNRHHLASMQHLLKVA